jgi:hypothetical protein
MISLRVFVVAIPGKSSELLATEPNPQDRNRRAAALRGAIQRNRPIASVFESIYEAPALAITAGNSRRRNCRRS